MESRRARCGVRADTEQLCFAYCDFTTDREVTATAFREFKRGLGMDAEMLGLLSALHRNLDDAAGRAVLCVDDAK